MRTKLIILSALLLLSHACREIHVKTVVKNNGQIMRSYTLKHDIPENGIKQTPSNDAQDGQLPNLYYPVDTSWNVKTFLDTSENKKVSTYTRLFENIEELNHYYQSKDYGLKPLNPDIEIKRNFRWLKTINHYKESMQQIFSGSSPEEFFSAKEMSTIKAGEMHNTEELKQKYERWVAYHITDEIANTVQNYSKNEIDLVDWKNIMHQRIKMSDSNSPLDKNNPFNLPELKNEQKELDFSDFNLLIGTIEKYSNTTLKDTIRMRVQKHLEQRMEIYIGLYTDELFYSVQLPGKIISSNADSIKQNTAYWKMSPFIVGAPFEMEVVSEQSNAGVAITIGAILIILIFIWLIRRKG